MYRAIGNFSRQNLCKSSKLSNYKARKITWGNLLVNFIKWKTTHKSHTLWTLINTCQRHFLKKIFNFYAYIEFKPGWHDKHDWQPMSQYLLGPEKWAGSGFQAHLHTKRSKVPCYKTADQLCILADLNFLLPSSILTKCQLWCTSNKTPALDPPTGQQLCSRD